MNNLTGQEYGSHADNAMTAITRLRDVRHKFRSVLGKNERAFSTDPQSHW